MSRTDLGEGLVILPSLIAPGPAGGVSGHPNQSQPEGELHDEEPVRTVLPVSSASAWSPRALRSDTGVTAWRLTEKAISHLFGSPNPPYRRVDEILSHRDLDTAAREQGGTSNSSGRT